MSRRFETVGLNLELPDLNRPSFAKLTYSTVLAYLTQELSQGESMNLIGSSMGGHLSARWAQLHPEMVGRMVLLCPGFDLASRWPSLMGDRAFDAWKTDGHAHFEDQTGDLVPLHYAFLEDARKHPAFPVFSQPTVIIHGRNDDIVPISSSRQVAREQDNVELIEVDDDHALGFSLDTIWDVVVQHFGLSI